MILTEMREGNESDSLVLFNSEEPVYFEFNLREVLEVELNIGDFSKTLSLKMDFKGLGYDTIDISAPIDMREPGTISLSLKSTKATLLLSHELSWRLIEEVQSAMEELTGDIELVN